jgi:hypothetical protein
MKNCIFVQQQNAFLNNYGQSVDGVKEVETQASDLLQHQRRVKQKQNKQCRDKTVQASNMRSVVGLTSLGRYRFLPDVQDAEVDQAFEAFAGDEPEQEINQQQVGDTDWFEVMLGYFKTFLLFLGGHCCFPEEMAEQ